MDELRQQITALSGKNTESEIVSALQEIGKSLLTEYVIKADDLTLEPLFVEAYYYNEANFKDSCVHKTKEQKQFEVWHFHRNTNPQNSDIDMRNGADICLSCGDYYLSFLLKYTLVNGEILKQSELAKLIQNSKPKLVRKNRQSSEILFTKRINIKDELKLAIARDFNKFPGKEKYIKEYLQDSTMTKEQKAAFCKEKLGYILSEYKD